MLKIFKNLSLRAEDSVLTIDFDDRFKIIVDLSSIDNKSEIESDKKAEVDKKTEEVVVNKVETKKKKETPSYKKEWFNDGFNSW